MAAVLLASSAFPTLIAAQKVFAVTITVNSQAELVNALADSGNDTINIGGSFSTTSEVVINHAVTIHGGGHTISPTFTGSGSDNSVIEIIGTDNVAINDLVIDGSGGTGIHGLNVYNATGVGLNNFTSKNNDKSGVVVNSSTVTVTNVVTSGNGWHGINVDQKISGTPAVLTVNGTSNQTDSTPHIFVDDTTLDVAVYDTNNQYVAFTVGNAKMYKLKPVGTITSPTAGQLVSGTIDFTATYEDWDNGVKDDAVQWAVRKATCAAGAPGVAGNVDGLSNTYAWNGAEFSASLDTTGWADGEYCFVFNPTDDSGYPDVRKTVTFVVDNTAPSKPHILGIYKGHNSNGANFLDCGGYTDTTQIRIDWESNPESDIAYYWIGTKFNVKHKKVTTNTHYDGNMTPGNNPYYYTVIAVDNAGNESPVSDPCYLTLDQESPVATITSHSNGSIVNGTITVEGTVTDDTDLGHYNLSLYPGSADLTDGEAHNSLRIPVAGGWTTSGQTNVGGTSASVSRTLDTTLLADGEYQLRLAVRDAVGNRNNGGPHDGTTSVHIVRITVDNTAPDAPAALGWKDANDDDVPDNGFTNLFNGTAYWSPSASSDVDHYIYKYWNDISSSPYNDEASAWTSNTAGIQLPGVFNQGEGVHHFCVAAVDAAGNISACSASFAITYDATAPDVEITGFGQTGNVIQPNATAADPSTPLTYSWNDPYPSDVTISNTSALNPTFTVATDGTYTFELTVTDAAGNSATMPFTFTFTTPPAPQEETESPEPTPPAFTNVTTTGGNPTTPVPLTDDNAGAADPQVLSTSTTEPSDVEGASTEVVENAASAKSGSFLGLGWWWLAVLGALAILWLLFGARRRSEDRN